MMMEDHIAWLNDGTPKKTTKFINHLLKTSNEFKGLYVGIRKARNTYGKTLHYIFKDDRGEEFIFDSRNPMIADKFKHMLFGSYVRIRRTDKDGLVRYKVFCFEGKQEENREENKRDKKHGYDQS